MSSKKVANAYIVIVPKFDNLKKNIHEELDGAAKQASEQFGRTFNNGINSAIKNGIGSSFRETFKNAGVQSGEKFSEGFSKTAPRVVKVVSENLAANSTQMVSAGRKSGTAFSSSLQETAVKSATATGNRVGHMMGSGLVTALSSVSSSITSVGSRIGNLLISGIRSGLSRGMASVKSALSSILHAAIPNGKSYGLNFSKQFLTGFRSGGVIAGITSALAYTGIFSVLSTVGSATSTAVARVDTMANFPKVMTNLGFSSDLAASSVQAMSDALDGLPTSLDEMTSLVSGYTAAIGDLDKATKVGIAFNNAMLAGGQGTAMASSAMEQFRQILTKGKPDLQDWKSLMMAAPGQMKQLAKAVVGVEDTNALYEYLGGGLGADDIAANADMYKQHMNEFLDAVIKLNEEGVEGFASFEQQARDATQGIDTALTNLKIRIGKTIAQVLDTIGQTTISGVINNFSKKLQDELGPFLSNIVIGFRDAFNLDAWNEVNQMIDDMSERLFPTGEDRAVAYGNAMAGVVNRIVETLKRAMPTIETAYKLIGKFIAWVARTSFNTVDAFINRIADNMPRITKALDDVENGFKKAFPSDGGFAVTFGNLLAEGVTVIIEHMPKAVDALSTLADEFKIVFGDTDFVTLFIDTLKKALTFAIDVFGGFTSTLDLEAFKKFGDDLAFALGKTFSVVSEDGSEFKSTGTIFGGVLATMANSAVALLDALTPTIGVLAGGFSDTLVWIRDNLPTIAKNVGDFIATVVTGTDWKGIGHSIFELFQSFAEGLGVVGLYNEDGAGLGQLIVGILNQIPSLLEKVNPLVETLGKAIRWVAENIDWLVPSLVALVAGTKALSAVGSVAEFFANIKMGGLFGKGTTKALEEGGAKAVTETIAKETDDVVETITKSTDEVAEAAAKYKSGIAEMNNYTTAELQKTWDLAGELGNEDAIKFMRQGVGVNKPVESALVETTTKEMAQNSMASVARVGTEELEGGLLSKAMGLGEKFGTKIGESAAGKVATKIGGKLAGMAVPGLNAVLTVGLIGEGADLLSQLLGYNENPEMSNPVADFFHTIAEAIQPLNDVLNTFFEAVWTPIKEQLIDNMENNPAIQYMLDAFGRLKETIGGISKEGGPFLDMLKNIADFVGTLIGWSLAGILEAIAMAIGLIVDAVNLLVQALKWLCDRLADVANGIAGIPDWIAGGWNDFMNSLPSFDASVNWGVPYMADGGRANNPTLALIGEGNSDEAVLPLRQSTYDEIAKGINQRQLTDGSQNEELLEGIRALMGSMVINLDGRTLGKVSAPYNDRALGARSRLANRGVAMV